MIKTPLSTVIGGAFWTLGATVIGGAKLSSETVMKKLFSNNEQGFFYDPNDLSTMFQDAAGTVPVTAAGQPVGLMLDKSKGLVLGLETNTNASFNDWSGGKPVGYNLFKNDTTTFIEQSINGVRMRSTDGTNVQLTRGIAAGKYYEVVINVDSLLSGSVALESQGRRVKLIASSGVHTFRFYALSAWLDLKRGGGVTDFTIRSLSIKELAGNHAYSPTSASRPIFQQKPILGNELVVNGDFSNGLTSWIYSDANVTNGVLNVVSTGTAWRSAYQNVNVTVGRTYLLSLKVLKSGTDNAFVTYGPLSNESSLKAYTAKADTLQYKSYVFTATEPTHRIRIQNGSSAVGFTVSADDISVREITGYLTDQNYLQFDGVDDFLQTNNINFTATDKVSLFAGVRKLSDATTSAALCEFSNNSTNINGTFSFFAPTSPNAQYQFRSKGTSASVYASSPTNAYPAPHSTVLTGFGSPPQNIARLRVNGIQVANTPTGQGSSVYGNYPLYIGRRGGTSLPFNGHLYSLIGIGRLTTDSETVALEKSIAKNVGVTLNV